MLRVILSAGGCLLLALSLTAANVPEKTAPARPAETKLSWRQTDTSVALLNGDSVVWSHVHDRKVGKPYMRFGLLDGTELTRPWPIPKGYIKSDHVWHRALWWSWKAINGVNYWEKNQQGTDPIKVKVTTNKDGSASILTTISYHEPDKPPVATEERLVRVGPPDGSGSYLITWRATFRSAGKKAVVFNKNSYGGFALRLAGEFCGDKKTGKPAWKFSRSAEPKANKGRARWMAYSGVAQNGKPTSVAIFDHPANPRHPALWQMRTQYPYLNPSFTCKEDYTLAPGKSLRLTYGVLIHNGKPTVEALEKAWKSFAASAKEPK